MQGLIERIWQYFSSNRLKNSNLINGRACSSDLAAISKLFQPELDCKLNLIKNCYTQIVDFMEIVKESKAVSGDRVFSQCEKRSRLKNMLGEWNSVERITNSCRSSQLWFKCRTKTQTKPISS